MCRNVSQRLGCLLGAVVDLDVAVVVVEWLRRRRPGTDRPVAAGAVDAAEPARHTAGGAAQVAGAVQQQPVDRRQRHLVRQDSRPGQSTDPNCGPHLD